MSIIWLILKQIPDVGFSSKYFSMYLWGFFEKYYCVIIMLKVVNCLIAWISRSKVKLHWLSVWSSLVAETVMSVASVLDPWVRRAPGEGNATHSSILAWQIPWTEEPEGLQSMGSQRVGHYWVTNTLASLLINIFLNFSWVRIPVRPMHCMWFMSLKSSV